MQFVLFIAVVVCGTAPPPDLKGKTAAQLFKDVLPGLGAKDIGARQGPQQQWQALCLQAGAPGNEELRTELCNLMCAKLGADTPVPARVFLLEQLEFLGRGECLFPVAVALDDPDENVRDAAARCLANNPAPAATKRLLVKLPATRGKDRAGLINALGYRADPEAVVALTQELSGTEPAAVAAAAKALGKVGSFAAAQALAAARPKADGPARIWIADAYLRCADHLLKDGKDDVAWTIYQQLSDAKEPRSVRLAAFRGVLRASRDAAGDKMLTALAGDDADARAIALGEIETASARALQVLASYRDKLPAARQVELLGALAARGDRSLQFAALAGLKSPAETVQKAAVLALGKLGDAGTVPLLIDTLFTNPKLAATARESLSVLAGAEVDEKIIGALRAEKDTGRRGTLVGVLESRRTAAAVPLLLEYAQGDGALRSSALAALRQLAEPRDVPTLLQILLKAPKGKEREEAERTLVAVCEREPDPESRATPLLAALHVENEGEVVAVLPLLGRLGGAKARATVTRFLASPHSELHAAVVNALCSWPDPSVSADLLKLAQGDMDPKERLQALRGVIRVNSLTNSLPGDKTNAERLAMLKQAMELATRDEERNQVLDGVSKIKEVESLRFALPYLDHQALAQRACRTVVELAHSKTLREPNRAEFHRALDRVLVICRDKDLVERAKKYKAGN